MARGGNPQRFDMRVAGQEGLVGAEVLLGRPATPPGRTDNRVAPPPLRTFGTFPCAGLEGCTERVALRGSKCSTCAEELPRRTRHAALVDAFESASPDGSRDWCRPGDPLYAKTTARLRRGLDRLAHSPQERQFFRHLVDRAEWTPKIGGLLLLGPTGIGKSRLLIAMALTLADRARQSDDPELLRLAAGARYMNAHFLNDRQREIRENRDLWGGVKQRRLHADIAGAKNATVLFLDETGLVDDRDLTRSILRTRYEQGAWRPVIAASGCKSLAELQDFLGANVVRTIWQNGLLLDLTQVSCEP